MYCGVSVLWVRGWLLAMALVLIQQPATTGWMRRPAALFFGRHLRKCSQLHCSAAPAVDMDGLRCHVTRKPEIFCNTELHMAQINAIGFDMDYTLAQYLPSLDLLAYEGTKQKLVANMGYPAPVSQLVYDFNNCRRGCVIHIKRGNVLKLDQYRYLRAVQHGLTAMSADSRKAMYRESYQEAESFTPPDYINIDTLFDVVAACLYAQLVEMRDQCDLGLLGSASEQDFFRRKSYEQLWHDMSKCLSQCHRDGAIKHTVAQNPKDYIVYDPMLFEMLKSFQDAGKKVFLVTNSLWDYTHVVMNYLLDPDSSELRLDWTKYFDVIVVGANKPAFLKENTQLSFFKVNPLDGSLSNIELPANDVKQLALSAAEDKKIFQGGNAQLLHSLLDITTGDSVLYVGDHIYSDVVRSKRKLGWRTCLIVPELKEELRTYQQYRHLQEEIVSMRELQYDLENSLDRISVGLLKAPHSPNASDWRQQAAAMDKCIDDLRTSIKTKQQAYDEKFHPRWGQLFKAGFQESRISKQIRNFACLYTSQASNLALVSTMRPFRPMRDDVMPHDLVQ